MNLKNKFVLGLAQSDKNYGLDKNNKFSEVFDFASKLDFKYFDTSSSYINSHLYIKKISQKKNIKIISKSSFDGLLNKNYKKRVINELQEIISKNEIKKFYAILIHNPTLPLNKKKWDIIYKVLKEYKNNGIIKKIGISVYSRFELDQILKVFTPEIIQFPLNLFNQTFADRKTLLELKNKGIELHARSIFLQGLLLKNYKDINKYFYQWETQFRKFSNFLKKNKLKKLRACLIFLIQNNLVDKFVIGINNKRQFQKIINDIGILAKSKKKLKKYDFSELATYEDYLIDPRYWQINNLNKKYNLSRWLKVKNKILNGGMLLSKRPDQFLPGGWPAFYKKAENCFVWDNLNNKYLDFSLMGIGTNVLGYANKKINSFVKKIIDNGSISTLNSNLDFELTKKLIKLHPWADMATYARTGAEANSIAIRIARSFSNRDEIAVCGYHGWHDWYISSNLQNKKNLDEIHLSGLSTIGIPKKLKGITHPFKYNDIQNFKNLIKNKPNIGVVFMEVERNEKPKINFLRQIRNITSKKEIVLVFDECTSGFRETFGGLHKKYKIYPDLAVFGKALGNGIPITAVIGKEKIMNAAQQSFISSTFWTDGTGPAAALATLEEMNNLKSWVKISNIGKKIKKFWKYLSKKYNVNILIYGIDALPSFKFKNKMNIYFKTFLTQEMLKKNILATNSVYCCIYHEKYLKIYFRELEKVFIEISQFIKGKDIMKSLNYPLSRSGFSRLN